jgi:hypothetical protein
MMYSWMRDWLRGGAAAAVIVCFLCSVRPSPANAGALAIGVNIHGATAQELDEIRAAGFRVVRLDLSWEKIERRRGEYDWTIYDRLVGDLDRRGIRALLVLDYGNSLYMVDATKASVQPSGLSHFGPTSQEEINGYARWGAAAARHFESVHPILELWNEPDMDGTWKPQPDPTSYARLSFNACHRIRNAVPDAYVIGPAVAHTPTSARTGSPFLDQILNSSAAPCFNAISVHPYPGFKELGWTPAFWNLLKGKLRSHNLSDKELVRSESGLSLYSKPRLSRPATATQQAIYAVEMFALDAASGISVSIWYDWRDDGGDTSNAEDGFGLTTRDGSPKPAYFAVRTFSRFTDGANVVCRAGGTQEQKTSVLFRDSEGHFRLMAWTSKPGPQGSIDMGHARVVSVTDMLGNPMQFPAGQHQVALTENPIYIVFDADGLDVRRICRVS